MLYSFENRDNVTIGLIISKSLTAWFSVWINNFIKSFKAINSLVFISAFIMYIYF